MAETTGGRCQQCGAALLPKWRFCVACSAPVPGAPRQAQGQLAESLRHLPSTHRPDKTVVFVPELRDARLKRERRNKRIVVIAVLGCMIVAAIGFALWRANERQKVEAPKMQREAMARRDLDLYARAFEAFRNDVGRYPTLQEGMGALIKRPSALASWRGPYIEADYSVDPWGHDYVYQAPNDGATYSLSTYGPEGEGASKFFLQVNSESSVPITTATP